MHAGHFAQNLFAVRTEHRVRNTAVAYSILQGTHQGRRLLVNLFLHVVTVPPAVDRIGGELAIANRSLDLAALGVIDAHRVPAHDRHITLFEKLEPLSHR